MLQCKAVTIPKRNMPRDSRRALMALAAATAMATPAFAQTVSNSDLGPTLIVPNTTPANPRYPYQPDGRIAYLPDTVGGQYQMYWAGGNFRSLGSSITSQSGPTPAYDLLPGTPAPSFDQHNWLMSVYRQNVSQSSATTNQLIGFFHAEDYNFNGVGGATWKSQGVAYSSDNGVTWTNGGQILSVAKPATPTEGGFGDQSVIWDAVNSRWMSFTGEGPYAAMSTDPLARPGTWFKYSGGGFTSAGLNGAQTKLPGLESYAGGNPDYIYSSYLGKWCRVWVDNFSGGKSVLLSTTSDLVHYDTAVTVVPNTSVNSISYPTVIGDSDVSMGQDAWIYYAVFPASGGQRQFTGQAIHLSKITATTTAWSGSAGDGNWATAANWGGTAISDEGQSLVFNTGSTQTNNLPAGTRVQGLTFNAGAGENLITATAGNSLELEGDVVNNSTATQTYIGDVRVRTAQATLNAAAGDLVIGGAINVNNSGGLLVTGSHDTTLGAITQSGLLFGNGGGFADTQLIKNSTGLLTIGGTGTFAGQTFINAGTLQLASPLALQSSTVILAVDNSLNLNGLNATLGGLSGTGALAFGGASTLSLGNSNPPTNYAVPSYAGALGGNGSLAKIGTSAQALSGNNTFTGALTIDAGTLAVTGSNLHTGGTYLNGGALAVALDSAFGSGSVVFNGGTLTPLTNVAINRTLNFAGTGTIDTNGQALTIAGSITGGGALTKSGTGVLTIVAANAATAGEMVLGGALNVASLAALGSGSVSLNAGALQLGASFDASSRGIFIGATGGAIDTNAFSATFASPITGSGGLTKTGNGTLTLSVTTAYSGATTINAGALQSTVTNGNPFGTKGFTLNGGVLSLLPTLVSASSSLNLALSSAASPAITTTGPGGIVLGRNGNKSVTMLLGQAGGVGIARGGKGTVTVSNGSGIASLGATTGEKLTVAGTTPTVTNGIVAPWMVGQASPADATADFLTYSAGYKRTSSYTPRTGTFTPIAGEVSNVTSTATANSGNPYALRVGGVNLNLGATLTLGDGSYAGVLLNGGSISGGMLALGTAEGLLYTSSTVSPAVISSTLTGSGGITVFGPGKLTLANSSNSFSGSITVNGSTLAVGANGQLGNVVNSVALNGGTLLATASFAADDGAGHARPINIGTIGATIDTAANLLTVSGTLTGTGTLTKSGNGTLILSGGVGNTMSSPINVNAGVLQTGNGASLASTTGMIAVASGAAFNAFGNFDGATVSNPITVNGTGTSNFGAINGGGNVALGGAITLNTDAKISHDWNNFTVSGPVTGANRSLVLASTQAGQPFMVFNGAITLGTGAITLPGPNGVALNAPDSFSGGTTLNAGTLQLGDPSALGSGSLSMNAGTLDLNGESILIAGVNGTAGTVIGNGSSSNAATLTVNGNGGTTFAGILADSIGGGSMPTSLNVAAGTFTLAATNTFSGSTRVPGGTLVLTNSFAIQNSTLDLNAADNGTISAGSLTTLTLGGLQGARNFPAGVSIVVGGNGQSTLYSGNLGGGGSLIKTGSGLLELAGSNSSLGGTTISGGALQFDLPASLPTGQITLNAGGAVVAAGAFPTVTSWLNSGRLGSTTAGAIAVSGVSSEAINLTTAGGGAFGSVTLGAVGSATYSGVLTPLANTFRLGGGGGTLTYTPAITGGVSVAVANPGTVILLASNNFTGSTSVTAGTLKLGNTNSLGKTSSIAVSPGATLDENGFTQASRAVTLAGSGVSGVGALYNSSTTANASVGTVILSADASIGVAGSAFAARMDIGGGATAVNGGSFTLSKTGPGPLRINAGAFTVGGINVQGGAFDVLSNNNVLPAGRPVSVAGGATLFLYFSNDAANTTLAPGAILEINSGTNTLGGTTTLAGAGSSGFAFDAPIPLLATGRITGTGALNVTGNGGLSLVLTNSSNDWTGGTTLGTGTLQIGNGGTAGVLPGNLASSGAVVVNRSDTVSIAGTLSGAGSFTQAGAGTTILSATSSFTGLTRISAGKLDITGAVAGSTAITVDATNFTAGLILDGANAIPSGGSVTGTGANPGIVVNAPQAFASLNTSGSSTFTSGTSTVGAVTGNGTLAVLGGSLTTNSIHHGGLSIGALSTVTIARDTQAATGGTPLNTSSVTSLSVNGTGTLDLKNNGLIVTDTTQFAAIATSIAAASDGNVWDKPGITSSLAAANASDHGVGYALASSIGSTSFNGQSFADAVLVRYTLLGDTNLKGSVDLHDYSTVVLNFGKTGTAWSDGNFDYTGTVGLGDYTRVIQSFGRSDSTALSSPAGPSARQTRAVTAGLTLKTAAAVIPSTAATDVRLVVDVASGNITLISAVQGSHAVITAYTIKSASGSLVKFKNGATKYFGAAFQNNPAVFYQSSNGNTCNNWTGIKNTSTIIGEGFGNTYTSTSDTTWTNYTLPSTGYSVGQMFKTLAGGGLQDLTFQWDDQNLNTFTSVVDYVGGSVPEPACMSLLAAGAAGALCRRRRRGIRKAVRV